MKIPLILRINFILFLLLQLALGTTVYSLGYITGNPYPLKVLGAIPNGSDVSINMTNLYSNLGQRVVEIPIKDIANKEFPDRIYHFYLFLDQLVFILWIRYQVIN